MADLFTVEALSGLLSCFTILGFWQILYKENAWFKIAENLMVAGAAANIMVIGFKGIRDVSTTIPSGQYHLIIPLICALLMFLTFLPGTLKRKTSLYSHLGPAILLGVGLGTALNQGVWTDGAQQIKGAILSSLIGADILTTLTNLLMLVGMIGGILYFTFTVQQKGAYGYVSKFGRYIFMASFAATMAGTMNERVGSGITLFTGYLVVGWGPYTIAAFAIYIVADILYRKVIVKKVPAV